MSIRFFPKISLDILGREKEKSKRREAYRKRMTELRRELRRQGKTFTWEDMSE